MSVMSIPLVLVPRGTPSARHYVTVAPNTTRSVGTRECGVPTTSGLSTSRSSRIVSFTERINETLFEAHTTAGDHLSSRRNGSLITECEDFP